MSIDHGLHVPWNVTIESDAAGFACFQETFYAPDADHALREAAEMYPDYNILHVERRGTGRKES